MLDVRYSHLYFYQSLNRPQRGLSAIAELLVDNCECKNFAGYVSFAIAIIVFTSISDLQSYDTYLLTRLPGHL